MMQGDSYNIPIEIMAEESVADPSVFAEVEIVFGSLVKKMTKNEISFDEKEKVYLFPISQLESMNMPERVKAQVRVKLKGSGNVIGISLGEVSIDRTMSKAVL